MAVIIKFAPRDKKGKFGYGDHTNKDAVARGVYYINNKVHELPKEEQLFGFMGIPEGASLDQAITWMMKAKQIYGAEDGVQVKHIIISFGKKPECKKRKLKKYVEQVVGIWKGRYQICWGFHHKNKGSKKENFHLHILVNTVDMKNGKRLDLNYKRWNKFKKNATKKWETIMSQEKSTIADV